MCKLFRCNLIKYFVFGLLFFLLTLNSYSQKPIFVFTEDIDSGDKLNLNNLHHWIAGQTKEYTGVYHFGESEWEWDLLIIIDDSVVVVQAFSSEWGKVDNSVLDSTWRNHELVYRNAKCVQNKIVSDSLSGYFMEYGAKQHKQVGMIIPYKGSSLDTAEFGYRTSKDVTKYSFFAGDYPELSWKIQYDAYFASRTSEQLQIMRNEIYARYGQRFAKNGKMYSHFKAKGWYRPFRENVQSCLTEIEMRNIAKINAMQNKN